MKILIVGEGPSAAAAETGEAFAGASGYMLRGFLRSAGIDPEVCHFTNVFNFAFRDVENLMTKEAALAAPGWPTWAAKTWVHRNHAVSLAELTTLRADLDPTLIIALGDTALWALTHQRGIARYRGTPLLSFDGLHKVLPTYEPEAVLRKYALKPIVHMDFQKAARQAEFREVRRPSRTIVLAPNLAEIRDFCAEYIVPAEFIAVDTETKAGQITEVGIAVSPHRAIVIPFWCRGVRDGNYWPTLSEEVAAWKLIARILREKPQVGQNYQYDMTYFYKTLGIQCPMFIGDTMLLHHALEPELEKSLGFLGSIYTDEPAWKFMRESHGTLKKED